MTKSTVVIGRTTPRRAWSVLARGTIVAGFATVAALAVSTSASPALAACNGGIQCERQFETGYGRTPNSAQSEASFAQLHLSIVPPTVSDATSGAASQMRCSSGIQCERQLETGYGYPQR